MTPFGARHLLVGSRRPRRSLLGIVVATAVAGPSLGQAPARPRADLAELSLEQLASLEVTAASRKPEVRWKTAAAVHVITRDEIRRSGATTVVEALRLAPGVHVARINSSQWAVGIRGFASRLSRSVLVLIDGRAVYSPLFAGTYWEVQDVLLEDIERIEVVRGPGGTLWGANAVHGVVNILTRSSRDTLGGAATAGTGSLERAFASVRHGGTIGERFTYRVYAKGADRGTQAGPAEVDSWHLYQAGFRADVETRGGDELTLQGDLYGGRTGQRSAVTSYAAPFTRVVDDEVPVSGANLLARWQRDLAKGASLSAQGWYQRTRRVEPAFEETRDTFDLDLHHRFGLPGGQDVVWGLGLRITADRTGGVPTVAFAPAARTDRVFSAFVQDQFGLADDRLHVTLGAKLEHNDYSGFEVQPSVRLLWQLAPGHAVWAAASRAVRTPSRADANLVQAALIGRQGQVPIFVRTTGDGQVAAERARGYELGYRVLVAGRVSLDVASFYNRYTDLLGARPGTPFVEPVPPSLRLVIPILFRNLFEGEGYGAEISADAQVTRGWRVAGAYSWLELQVEPIVRAPGLSNDGSARNNPRHQVQLRSSSDLPGGFTFDAALRRVGALPGPAVPAYVNLDLRLSWQPGPRLELAAVGHNLLQASHREFSGTVEVERGAYATLTLRW